MTSKSETQRRQKIASLNDALRRHGEGGRVMMTSGIQALGQKAVTEIINNVREFNAFTKDNDPWGEHDCALLTVNGNRIMFKVDYLDRDLQYASPDPSDVTKTCRILTILLAEEY